MVLELNAFSRRLLALVFFAFLQNARRWLGGPHCKNKDQVQHAQTSFENEKKWLRISCAVLRLMFAELKYRSAFRDLRCGGLAQDSVKL